MNSEHQSSAEGRKEVITSDIKTIYADKVFTLAVGPSVSKIVFATEVAEDKLDISTQLIMPTPALFDAIDFMVKSIWKNEEVKEGLLEGLEELREKFNAAP